MTFDRERRTVRGSLIGLVVLQVGLIGWILLDPVVREASGPMRLHSGLFLLAVLSSLFAGYLGLRPKLAPLREGMGWLIVGLLMTSGASLAVIDYPALGRAGPAVPVVFLVSTWLGYLRSRPR
jgi:hypothetical protein